MRVRFLVGPAGSGKTFRCIAEIREALSASAEGPGLLLVAPRQSTLQLEQQLLSDPSLPGYTRLEICHFERLAYRVFEWLRQTPPRLLSDEGRTMVLRALLAKERKDLKLFRASARLSGFAHQLSLLLGELERHGLTVDALNQLARQLSTSTSLSCKLQDLATLLGEYLRWLEQRGLRDSDYLLAAATEALKTAANDEIADKKRTQAPKPGLNFAGLWVDGFAEYSVQELNFLAAFGKYAQQISITFCVEGEGEANSSWLSHWSAIDRTLARCKKRFSDTPDVALEVQLLHRDSNKSRFSNNPIFQHLESFWANPRPYPAGNLQVTASRHVSSVDQIKQHLRMVTCGDPEVEAVIAAREIRYYVRNGGRYRDISVIVRNLERYHLVLQKVFTRFEVPFFLDRREPVSHHPMAELTRSALRTVALGWQHEDWFCALKTGLFPAAEEEIDQLENEALARGWRGTVWQQPLGLHEASQPGPEQEHFRALQVQMEKLRHQLISPFHKFSTVLAVAQHKPNGAQLAEAYRELWGNLNLEEKLTQWAESESGSVIPGTGSVHLTVRDQMNTWLENIELAFTEAMTLREWLPVVEAGLAYLTVGVIPPALDQVLIGAIDRSRNPDIKLAIVLGLNETVFPTTPEGNALLTESDRIELENRNILLGMTARQQLAQERFYGYIACTRARERLVLTCAQQDDRGATLNPSPFLGLVRQLFPTLTVETARAPLDWRTSEHGVELLPTMLSFESSRSKETSEEHARGLCAQLGSLPMLSSVVERLKQFVSPEMHEPLSPGLAERLYGPILKSSVSRLEQFAACPFKFFVHSGLRAEERKLFELDAKEQGNFQHDLLALFHEQLTREGKRWRDITPAQARARVSQLAQGLMAGYRAGLLEASDQTRFLARVLTESLQDFVETLVDWMRQQYRFDPVKVEIPFGQNDSGPTWTIELEKGHRLELFGRIDRVDLHHETDTAEAFCVVVDYKSSQKKLEPLLLQNGLQLQLLAYLNVLRHWQNPTPILGIKRLVPAGVFYVNLHGTYERKPNRLEALADPEQDRKLAYRHTGRFDARVLRLLDSREEAREGDQFNYRLTRLGKINKNSREALMTDDFLALLDLVETNLRTIGRGIFAGTTDVSPFRKGALTACAQCEYQGICRIDPWTHRYRVLRAVHEGVAAAKNST